jgi:serine/threonine protein kinase
MGQVFLGFHMRLECDVAVKVLDPELQLRQDSRERLLREGSVLASIRHENIVQVHHCDMTEDGKVFVVMELLEGETLRQLCRRVGTLDALAVVKIGLQICRALERAHAAGVIHRDITPSNVMVMRDPAGLVKVIDFGICRVLDTFHARHPQRFAKPPGSRLATPVGVQLGNPEYMAPELLVREPFVPPNACTDVFSVAIVLFELLTGEHPFRRGDRKQARRVRELLPEFEYAELEKALADALRCDAERRTPTMTALREDLEMAQDCIVAQRNEDPRGGARLVRLDSFRPTEDEPEGRFLAVVQDASGDTDAAPEPPLAPVVALRPAQLDPVLPTDESESAPEPQRAAAPTAHAAALVLAAVPAPPRVAEGWFVTHMSSVILGAGIVAGVGATLVSQRLGESLFTDPARFAEVEAAADLCEQALEDTRASLAQVEQDLSVARGSGKTNPAAPTSPPVPTPGPVSRSTAHPTSAARHRSIRRSLDKVLAAVRECDDDSGGGRLSKLRARIRVEPNGEASAVELTDGASISVCVTKAVRSRRYQTGDEAEWVRHDFVFDSEEETP